ncbi:MAG: hypothetical protein AAF348_10995 [Bacteroidota bacterium]
MKKIFLILIIAGLYSCDDNDPPAIESFGVEYDFQLRTENSLTFSFELTDTDFPSYTVSSIEPNVSCCQGTFILENNVDATIGQGNLLNAPVSSGEGPFNLIIENFNDGMNYLTIQIDNGFDVFFFSFQFYFDVATNEVDYLAVMRSQQSTIDYFEAIFRYDYYTNSNIDILIELERGIREQPLATLSNGAGDFRYITSGGGTDVVKTTREKL